MLAKLRPPAAFLRALALLAVMLATTAAGAETQMKPWAGGTTPRLALVDLEGKAVDLKGLKGRVVLVNFWATWCEPCRDEMPALERLRARLKGRPFELLTVNYGESNARAADFIAKLQLSVPVLLDPEKRAAEAWKVKGLPMTFLVDAAGTVRYWTFGERDWSEGEAFGTVERLVVEASRARR